MSQTDFSFSYTAYPVTHHSSEQGTQERQDVAGFAFPYMADSFDSQFCGHAGYSATWVPQIQAQYFNQHVYYQQAITSPRSMTSKTSNTDASSDYPFYMARSASSSTDRDDNWGRIVSPAEVPIDRLHPQNELLSNMGSEFNIKSTHVAQMNLPMFSTLDIPEVETQEIQDSNWTAVQATQSSNTATMTNNKTTSQYIRPLNATQDTSSTSTQSSRASRRSRPRRRKTTSPTPKTRVYCPVCLGTNSKDYARGFKGEHELARHHAQKHSPFREVWYVVDRSPSHLLKNCERCRKGHIYGSEYGSAEHMRRKHSRMFGSEMMERLKGCTRRTALSKNRLKRFGWLEAKWVLNDGAVEIDEGVEEGGDFVQKTKGTVTGESFIWVQQQQQQQQQWRGAP